eukprot:TRINITY_DN40525_c0_g1_i1.p1 TRINITY_DN40525_c0_g1~~TRINITY_DN40525_c0_g1_i1.p1  ORF type:complete len:562 (-),score=98.27 TRINITY_DN40525_c0_g1_i1:21-1460(-)
MTHRQFGEFIAACQHTACWARCKQAKEHVNLYDVNSYLIKPWTRGTGCSIALRMNPEKPLRAELMVSHSWAEDLGECLEALQSFSSRKSQPCSTTLWFCAFAQYQAGDEPGDLGPSIEEQLQQDPFGRVVRSTCEEHGMVVVHTSTARVYERLWCVYEISEALRIDCHVGIAYSESYLDLRHKDEKLIDLFRATTSQARCSNPDDEERIRTKVEEDGGFKQLDWKIFQFRLQSLKEMMADKHLDWAAMLQDELANAEEVLRRGTFSFKTASARTLHRWWPSIARGGFVTGVLCAAALIAVTVVLSLEMVEAMRPTTRNVTEPPTPENWPAPAPVPHPAPAPAPAPEPLGRVPDAAPAGGAPADVVSAGFLFGMSLAAVGTVIVLLMLLACICSRRCRSTLRNHVSSTDADPMTDEEYDKHDSIMDRVECARTDFATCVSNATLTFTSRSMDGTGAHHPRAGRTITRSHSPDAGDLEVWV